MLKPAFSTVACPEWTLRQVAQRALENGFEAVELRTFGDASRAFACDPALTSEEKVRRMFLEAGVEPLCLGTGVRFDAPIFPPIVGLFMSDRERSVREGKRAIDLAVGIECPYVRVFGFEYPKRERAEEALGRISGRMKMVLDHADKSGVRVVLENGGAFETSGQMLELIEKVGHPLLGACYSLPIGVAAGEDPASAIRALGDRLWVAKIKDLKDGRPCPLGEGSIPCESFVRGLAASGFNGPLVYEWDRAWVPDLAAPEVALAAASRAMHSWLGAKIVGGGGGGGVAAKPAVVARH